MEPSKTPRRLSDLSLDPRNANKGKDRGRAVLRHSLRTLKAGRSLLADKKLRLIAGNKTRDAAIAEGFDEAIFVYSDGSKPVVVVRTDLDLETDLEAKELAIADNRAGELGLDWDSSILSEYKDEGVDFGAYFEPDEWAAMLGEEEEGEPAGADDDGIPYQNKYAVAVECEDEAHQEEIYNKLLDMGYKCKVLTL